MLKRPTYFDNQIYYFSTNMETKEGFLGDDFPQTPNLNKRKKKLPSNFLVCNLDMEDVFFSKCATIQQLKVFR